jgi:hypothetical protein
MLNPPHADAASTDQAFAKRETELVTNATQAATALKEAQSQLQLRERELESAHNKFTKFEQALRDAEAAFDRDVTAKPKVLTARAEKDGAQVDVDRVERRLQQAKEAVVARERESWLARYALADARLSGEGRNAGRTQLIGAFAALAEQMCNLHVAVKARKQLESAFTAEHNASSEALGFGGKLQRNGIDFWSLLTEAHRALLHRVLGRKATTEQHEAEREAVHYFESKL